MLKYVRYSSAGRREWSRPFSKSSGTITSICTCPTRFTFQAYWTERNYSPTRQAAAVYLKNRVYSSYFVDTVARPDQAPISPTDRNNLKMSILPLIAASASRAITVQLAGALKNVVARDFPEQWPNLVDDVKKLLASGNVNEVHAGCVTILEMVRAFRYVLHAMSLR